MKDSRKEIMELISRKYPGGEIVEWDGDKALVVDGDEIIIVWKRMNAIVGLYILELLDEE